ncbi:hypothetical protein RCZ04_05560 [Capnocytophaga sp. HP1101]
MLISYFNRLCPLTEEETALVNRLFTTRTYRKRYFVLQEGDIATHFHFIEKGCLKLYKTDDKGNEHIIQFATENHWITDINSFQNHTPARLAIEALEDTTVWQITHEKLEQLYTEVPKFNLIFRKLSERNQQVLQSRILEMLSGNAQDCYTSFAQRYPELLLRLPQTQIASFIGITPEFLSKMKAKMLRES